MGRRSAAIAHRTIDGPVPAAAEGSGAVIAVASLPPGVVVLGHFDAELVGEELGEARVGRAAVRRQVERARAVERPRHLDGGVRARRRGGDGVLGDAATRLRARLLAEPIAEGVRVAPHPAGLAERRVLRVDERVRVPHVHLGLDEVGRLSQAREEKIDLGARVEVGLVDGVRGDRARQDAARLVRRDVLDDRVDHLGRDVPLLLLRADDLERLVLLVPVGLEDTCARNANVMLQADTVIRRCAAGMGVVWDAVSASRRRAVRMRGAAERSGGAPLKVSSMASRTFFCSDTSPVMATARVRRWPLPAFFHAILRRTPIGAGAHD
eukprot:1809841-Prymnesium_polylepis.1